MRNILDVLDFFITEDKRTIGLNHKFDDLGLDSLDFLEIIMNIEDEYDIEIDDDEANGLKTVSDVIELLKSKGVSEKHLTLSGITK